MTSLPLVGEPSRDRAANRFTVEALFGAVRGTIRAAITRHAYHRAVRRIAHLSPHLQRDMGFDPQAVAEALEGDWHSIDCFGRR